MTLSQVIWLGIVGMRYGPSCFLHKHKLNFLALQIEVTAGVLYLDRGLPTLGNTGDAQCITDGALCT